MASDCRLTFWGVRGSSPLSGSQFLKYGGNTASLTLRTPQNSLIFLDAGTGIRFAETEIDTLANQVFLLLSHSHADHIQGMGMTRLPFLKDQVGYESTLLKIVGPNGITTALERFYDGEYIWPVHFSKDPSHHNRFVGIDYDTIHEIKKDGETIYIDSSTTIETKFGNHPVKSGVILYKIQIENENTKRTIVYATDNEFDFLDRKTPNESHDQYKQQYIDYIKNADLLIADAQYSEADYKRKFQGYGHSFPQQILMLASQAGVRKVYLTHHHNYTDGQLDNLQEEINNWAISQEITTEFTLAREGDTEKFEF